MYTAVNDAEKTSATHVASKYLAKIGVRRLTIADDNDRLKLAIANNVLHNVARLYAPCVCLISEPFRLRLGAFMSLRGCASVEPRLCCLTVNYSASRQLS